MKLNELVSLRNRLENSLSLAVIDQEIENNFLRLQELTNEIDPGFAEKINNFSQIHYNKKNIFQEDIVNIDKVISEIQDRIHDLSTKFFSDNYQFELENIDAESVRKVRVLKSNDEFESILLQRINLHSTWKYPALEIGCRDGFWTKYLVASDPLYIADVFPEFLSSAVEQFPSLYQGRVRKYIITDYFKIKNLPINQFGFIFSYNFFNYLSLDSIKQFLSQSFQWLRSGGRIIFTYNNADLPAAAGYAESYYMTYVPKSILIPMAESLGFETIFSFDLDPAYSIIEFQKPGDLTSIKLAQVLGETKLKTN